MGKWDDWRDFEPPTDRGVGESALPRGVGRRPASDGAATGNPARSAPAGGNARPFHRGKGSARITSTACYVDDEGVLVEEPQALAIGILTKGKKGNIVKPGWTRFQSRREGKRWVFLRQQERAGLIRGLRRQVRYALNVRRRDGLEETIAHWTCDFEYERFVGDPKKRGEAPDPIDGTPGSTITYVVLWQRVIEDCKGMRTEIYQRSKRHFEAQYGINITET